MIKINFGLEYDDKVFQLNEKSFGEIFLGSKQLLVYFEQIIGLSGIPNNNNFIRIEQFRQVIEHFLLSSGEVFFSNSFKIDPLATSDAILQKRDELVLAGWDFEISSEMPQRLQVITALELFHQSSDTNIDLGFADRFQRVIEWIPHLALNIECITINEPKAYVPDHFIRFFDLLAKRDISVSYRDVFEKGNSTSDLDTWKSALLGNSVNSTLKGDGSLVLLQSKRDTNAANWLAKFWEKNPSFVDATLMGFKSPILDNCLMNEGLPSMGVLSTSEVRPTLQILKLITTFFWYPVDPYKILEFVSLVVKPLNRKLGWAIAKELSSNPGLFGSGWNLAIANFFKNLEEDDEIKKNDIEEIRFQYRFWFLRKRVHINQSIPKSEVKEVYAYLADWAYTEFESKIEKNNSLLVVSEQAKRMVELLDTLPEQKKGLTHLELERMVQVVYESAPVVLNDAELGHTPLVYHNTAFYESVDKLLWWGFGDQEKDYFFANWYQNEFDYFEKLGLKFITPIQENQLKLWQRLFPVLNTNKQLFLLVMDKMDGQDMQHHPLLGDLKATFENLDDIVVDIDNPNLKSEELNNVDLPKWIRITPKPFEKTAPLIDIDPKYEIFDVEYHSFTSLESLLYYPHTWVLRSQCKFYPVSILSLHSESRVMGNLSHRFFELLLEEDGIIEWAKDDIYNWIDENANRLLAREGAVLLMYGREPDKEAFLHKVKTAFWTFVSILKSNRWKILGTEEKLEGEIENVELRGIADLILERDGEKAIVDFKWKGKKRRSDLLKNEEDLQLVLYLNMLDSPKEKHTAYYILSDSVLLARNKKAFEEAVSPYEIDNHLEVHNRILDKIDKTYQWRSSQLTQGVLEVRLERNINDLDMAYIEDANGLERLEMKRRNAPFDIFSVLVGDLD